MLYSRSQPRFHSDDPPALENFAIGGDELLYRRFTILRRGKKNYGLINWQ